MARRLDTPEIQQELITKLENLFARENLEKNTYFVSRMNDKMEIPLQVVYQQKEIYRVCPNGRYVLQALHKCPAVTVNQESLVVIPNVSARKVRIDLHISDAKGPVSLDTLINHIKENSKIPIVFSKTLGSNNAFLMTETEENAIALNTWIENNKLENEPVEHSIKEENVLKQFQFNVKDDLAKQKEKWSEDKKMHHEMKNNFEFFQEQRTKIPVNIGDANKVGDRIFANPYNYFFEFPNVPAPTQHDSPNKQKRSTATDNQLQQQQQMLQQYAMFIFQQQMQLQQQQLQDTENTAQAGNNLRKNNQKSSRKTRSKSRGAAKERKPAHANNNVNSQKDNNSADDSKTNKKTSKKATAKMPKQLLEDKETNFPSLGGATDVKADTQSAWTDSTSAAQPALPAAATTTAEVASTSQRKTRKLSSEKREGDQHRQVSESREKLSNRDRQVSESRERQVRQRGQSITKEEVVYVRKGKDIKITYEKDALVSIFLKMRDTITPPASIVESSKDQFIPVISLNAQKEIEVTKPTEVVENHSNPGTPYQVPASMPYRKSSISRSNIKRKESERIIEVDEGKAL